MRKVFSIAFLMLTSIVMQAQTQHVVELAKSVGGFAACPDVYTNPKTKKTSVVWYSTNNAWIKDSCEAKNVCIEKDYLGIFPEIAHVSLDEQPYVPMSWRLTEENGETVMHCYFRMPADEVSNLWLTSEETCLVDSETGVQYRIRRTEPDTFRKHFWVKGKKGDVLDLKIFFAPLPATTQAVTIFGIPNWNLVGDKISIHRQSNEGIGVFKNDYDTIPQFHQPRILLEHMSENKPYDLQNWNTWKVLTDVHLIKPLTDETLALWRTPQTTYVAIAYEQNWTTEYFTFKNGTMLLDEYGHQYKLRKVQGVPMDELFFMKGNAGDYIAFLMEFEPLPLNIRIVTFIEPDMEPFNAWGSNNKGTVIHNLDVWKLRDNQHLFNYQPRVIVE